jgi:hypothetical protein
VRPPLSLSRRHATPCPIGSASRAETATSSSCALGLFAVAGALHQATDGFFSGDDFFFPGDATTDLGGQARAARPWGELSLAMATTSPLPLDVVVRGHRGRGRAASVTRRTAKPRRARIARLPPRAASLGREGAEGEGGVEQREGAARAGFGGERILPGLEDGRELRKFRDSFTRHYCGSFWI